MNFGLHLFSNHRSLISINLKLAQDEFAEDGFLGRRRGRELAGVQNHRALFFPEIIALIFRKWESQGTKVRAGKEGSDMGLGEKEPLWHELEVRDLFYHQVVVSIFHCGGGRFMSRVFVECCDCKNFQE